MNKWFVCLTNQGYIVSDGKPESFKTTFDEGSIGIIRKMNDENCTIWLIGNNTEFLVKKSETKEINIEKTGDKFTHKICNICHCLKPVEQFDKNQNNLHGTIRRPSCKKCRTSIDKRAPKTKQAKEMEKTKPQKGDNFMCPICRKRSIVGITAKIVADHDHHTGNIRAYICDSCNTGLGRFKNGENYLMNAIKYIESHDKLK
jgi:transcription elongation factor Elf1